MDFSIEEIFNQSWATVRKNLALCIGLTFVMFLALLTMRYLPLIGNLIWAPFQLGYLRCLWQMKNGKDFDYPDFFWGWVNMNRLGHVILLHILTTIFIIFGCLLLVIPGIWIAVATSLAMPILLLQHEADCVGAIQDSMALVKGRWWKVFAFVCVLGVIFMVGAMIFGIGALVATPLAALMTINLTEKLKSMAVNESSQPGFAPVGDKT